MNGKLNDSHSELVDAGKKLLEEILAKNRYGDSPLSSNQSHFFGKAADSALQTKVRKWFNHINQQVGNAALV